MLTLASLLRKDRVTIHDQDTIPDIDDVCDEAEEAQRQVSHSILALLALMSATDAAPRLCLLGCMSAYATNYQRSAAPVHGLLCFICNACRWTTRSV